MKECHSDVFLIALGQLLRPTAQRMYLALLITRFNSLIVLTFYMLFVDTFQSFNVICSFL